MISSLLCMTVFAGIYLTVLNAKESAFSKEACIISNYCQCILDKDGTGIDLKGLEAANIISNPPHVYFYPCSLNGESPCPDHEAFCLQKDNGEWLLLGLRKSAKFGQMSTGVIYINYTDSHLATLKSVNILVLKEDARSIAPKYQRTYIFLFTVLARFSPDLLPCNNATITTVMLRCSQQGTINMNASNPRAFDLYSKHACLRNVLNDETNMISSGGIFVIVFLLFSLLYLFGGMAILKFVRGASGVEMIPHYEFWSNLPYLVKDGAMFVARCGTQPVTYENI